ncbi:MAG: hypothetical protein GY925_20640 [Actinomycetia bacterium]|nr:hypothetical protein [Actinomycetes bacterium]
MSFTKADLESAIEKLGSLEFTDAEIEAIASVLKQGDEVDGFSLGGVSRGHDFLSAVSRRLVEKPDMGVGGPGSVRGSGPVRAEGYTATDDLWE